MRLTILVLFLLPHLASAQESCPSSFLQFLDRFESGSAFQTQNTIYPLKYSFVDLAADPEPRQVHKRLSRSEVLQKHSPIYPTAAYRREAHLIKKIKRESKTRISVHLHTPDTGYLLNYRFEKVKGCWKLVRFEDDAT